MFRFYSIIIIITTVDLIKLITTQHPSPCPNIFTYETRNINENDRWYGILTLQTNEQLTGIWIHVVLDQPALQLGNWFGNTSNVDNREFVIRHPKFRLEPNEPITVRFFVRYQPGGNVVPSVVNIRLNGKTVCTTNDDRVATTTEPTLHLSEIRLNYNNNNNNNHNKNNNANENRGQSNNRVPPGQNKRPPQSFNNNGNNKNKNKDKNKQQIEIQQQQQQPPPPPQQTTSTPPHGSLLFDEDINTSPNGFDYFAGDFSVNRPQTTTNQRINPPTIPTINLHQQQVECGRIVMQPSPLISYGQNTTKGQFPWHAAIYHSRGAELIYICGGTLISTRHILTAAHCAAKQQTNTPINANDLLVSLGKYILKKFGPEVQDIEVEQIDLHPAYNHSTLFNDIAILKLAHDVKITDYVRPCCLWDDHLEPIDLDGVVGRLGTVVGWGFNEHREISNDLMQTHMPIVSTVQCIYSNREFFSRFTFEKNFCAGYQNGTSVCNGDSGGGLLLPKRGTTGSSTVWQIRGVVSVGVALQGYGVCDPQHYAVFTDAAKYLNWIKDVMKK